jgi:hypothetical protein
MPLNPEFVAMLDRMKETHVKKNDDYSAVGPDENFTRAAELISWFNNNADKTFVNHIATKLARLSTLLNSDKAPNNESLDDSFLDLANYCVLWFANWKRREPSLRPAADRRALDSFKFRCKTCGCGFDFDPTMFVYNPVSRAVEIFDTEACKNRYMIEHPNASR